MHARPVGIFGIDVLQQLFGAARDPKRGIETPGAHRQLEFGQRDGQQARGVELLEPQHGGVAQRSAFFEHRCGIFGALLAARARLAGRA